ncbi:MAG: response regulator [Clostridia bacterium]|nr:response regulator [Clostridia bacterium]
MNVICVDDEPLAVEYTADQCRLVPGVEDVKGFTKAQSALEWIAGNPTDIALLDINMPETDGITLAARIKEASPQTAILFLTAYKEYALDAYAVHPSGYLLKPVSQEKLASEIAYAGASKHLSAPAHIRIKTFGYFDVYVDGRPIRFRLSKAKEILAYLVDQQGAGVTRAELFAAVWEDRLYDRKMQKQVDVYIRSLRETLREYGVPEIMEMEKGVLRVRPETFVCDVYRFFAGDGDAINSYRGEYMSSYAWADISEALLFRQATKNGNA